MSNNNDNSGAILAFAVVATVAYMAIALIFAAAAFLSLCMTGLAIAAWHKPITVFGQEITPQEAREFVARGLIGAVLLPAFVLFASSMFQVGIRQDILLYTPLAGYAFGSLVVGHWIEQAKQEEVARTAHLQLMVPPQPPIRTIDAEAVEQPRAEPAPFRFASWYDEEELRK